MADQLHKRFSNSQIKSLLESYTRKEIGLPYILSILGIGRSRFFEVLKNYRQDKDGFSVEHARSKSNNKITSEVEDDILAELYIEKSLINDSSNPIKHYNYSYIKDRFLSMYGHKVSLPTTDGARMPIPNGTL